MAGPPNIAQLPEWAGELLEEARVAHLGLLDERGRPRVLPISYALAGEAIWTAIDAKPKRGEPARIRRLRARPQAAVTVDRYDDDWGKLAWVQIVGSATVLDASRAGDALAALTRRYPQYRDAPPPGPLIRVTVEHAVCWRAGDR